MNKLMMVMLVSILGLASSGWSDSTSPRVIGLLFYADWCGSCKILDPRLDALKPEYRDSSIVFARLDFTNEDTSQASTEAIAELDLGEVIEAHADRTGFMLLVDAESKTVLDRLDRTMDETELRRRLDQALN